MSSECLLGISTSQFLFTHPEMLQTLRNCVYLQIQARSCCVCVLYAFRMPGVRRIPEMLFTGIKPIIRWMMQYLDQYTNHHLKTNGRAAFIVNTGWAQVYDLFGNACLSVWICSTIWGGCFHFSRNMHIIISNRTMVHVYLKAALCWWRKMNYQHVF